MYYIIQHFPQIVLATFTRQYLTYNVSVHIAECYMMRHVPSFGSLHRCYVEMCTSKST